MIILFVFLRIELFYIFSRGYYRNGHVLISIFWPSPGSRHRDVKTDMFH